jgi:hypothetical protein
MTSIFQPGKRPEPWMGLRGDIPSLAVVASNGEHGCVLWTVGAHVRFEQQECGWELIDLGLHNAPQGISIWEGVYIYIPEPWECSEPKGQFRKPTDAEWVAIREGRCPWDEHKWMVENYEEIMAEIEDPSNGLGLKEEV